MSRACYPYEDEQGRVLLRKLRFEKMLPSTQDVPFPKTKRKFRMEARSREGYAWCNTPSAIESKHPDLRDYFASLLYGLPALLRAIRSGSTGVTVYWTEGEKDADSINAAGGLAVSHWQGATSATLAQVERLRPWLGGVVVCADEDPKGAACALSRYRLLREVGIPTDRLRIVRPAGPAVLKRDVTDHLQDGYALTELVDMDLHKLERYVAHLTPEQLKEGSESYNAVDLSTWAPRTGGEGGTRRPALSSSRRSERQ
ncbi:MAG: toprim domain-containing protein [Dermatophilaceae bacterium]